MKVSPGWPMIEDQASLSTVFCSDDRFPANFPCVIWEAENPAYCFYLKGPYSPAEASRAPRAVICPSLLDAALSGGTGQGQKNWDANFHCCIPPDLLALPMAPVHTPNLHEDIDLGMNKGRWVGQDVPAHFRGFGHSGFKGASQPKLLCGSMG